MNTSTSTTGKKVIFGSGSSSNLIIEQQPQFRSVLTQLQTTYNVSTSQISTITSTPTFTGNDYTVVITQENRDPFQLEFHYNQPTNQLTTTADIIMPVPTLITQQQEKQEQKVPVQDWTSSSLTQVITTSQINKVESVTTVSSSQLATIY